MSQESVRDHLKLCVSKILLTMGWHSTMTAPVEILTDVLSNFMQDISKSTRTYANNFGMNIANLDHVALAFRDFNINVNDLDNYIMNVDSGETNVAVHLFPVPRESHLNFLKPGSKEMVTRPLHIPEHLPPMNPLFEVKEEEETDVKKEVTDEVSEEPFKKPADVVSSPETPKRTRLLMDEESRPIREISSVMMTTSGFLSPAREGKLPESRTPFPVIDAPPITVPHNQLEIPKKQPKLIKKIEKKKEKNVRDTFKPTMQTEIRKVPTKETTKSRIKANLEIGSSSTELLVPPKINSPNLIIEEIKPPPTPISKSPPVQKPFKFNKALEAARLKTEKLNTTITPIIPKTPVIPPQSEHIDKLFTEPDKKKVNIFKKISNVKNEKPDTRLLKLKDEIKQESRESSPDLIIDEAPHEIAHKVRHLSSDITIELINTPATPSISSTSERPIFDDYSPPHTPSTPKTPDMVSPSPPLVKEKRKRKDKSKLKKKQLSPMIDTDAMDLNIERPKTPEALGFKQEKADSMTPTIPFPFSFHGFAGGPGLIPPPLVNPLFSHLPMTPLIPSFGQPPYIPGLHPGLSLPFRPPKTEEIIQKSLGASTSLLYDDKSSPVVSSTTLDIPQMLPDDYSFKPEKRKEHKKEKKEKIKKKNKKDKIKDKTEKRKLKEERREKLKLKKEKKEKRKEKERSAEVGIPKITLKLRSPSPTSNVSDTRKLNIKPILKKDDQEDDYDDEDERRGDEEKSRREMSPELAKISALVTGQPKPKIAPSTVSSTSSVSSTKIFSDNNTPSPSSSQNSRKPYKPLIQNRTPMNLSEEFEDTPERPPYYINHGGWFYDVCIEDDMKEDIPRLPVPTPRVGPGPGRPRIHPIKPKPLLKRSKPNQQMVQDSEGNQVWICPACGRQDDGTPMIGCDDCDAWYHWVCVGIQIPPEDSEDWYCKQCIAKKQEHLQQTDKKKKRKKREKKEH